MTISIITVNLNNYEGLERTIKSVEAQTYKDFEWIVVDGGSTDGSRELIEEHASRIAKWVSEPDNGIYNAMNKGTRMSTGDYLLFLNSGDSLAANDVLGITAESINNDAPKKDIYIGRENLVDKQGKILGIKQVLEEGLTMYGIYLNTIPHQASFIHRDLLFHTPYDESLKIVADNKFFLESIVIRNASVGFLEKTISNFDCTGISRNSEKERAIEREQALYKMLPPRLAANFVTLTSHTQDYYRIRWIYNHKFAYLLFRRLTSIAMRINP